MQDEEKAKSDANRTATPADFSNDDSAESQVFLADSSDMTPPEPVVGKGSRSHGKLWLALLAVLVLIIAGIAYWLGTRHTSTPKATTNKSQTTAPKTEGVVLDTSKDYGNKYKDGLLPVGDGKYSSDAAKAGYIYTCDGYTSNIQKEQGGAGKRGPWFTGNNTQYDINKKAHVQGSATWSAEFSNTVTGSTRTVVTNDLPSHPTGVFPIATADPAYAYDKNPNAIKGQTLTFSLTNDPTYNNTPGCMGGQVGVMLTGVALFNGFDAAGRDAGAWEVQDSCDGHPQSEGEYHYHTLSACIKDVSVRTVIGYALDGFPITGPQLAPANILTTSDLDECHGITSQIVRDGKTVTMYHYVMTEDFPYSVSCFRGTAMQPPGQKPLPH
jgi:hypothetical protein